MPSKHAGFTALFFVAVGCGLLWVCPGAPGGSAIGPVSGSGELMALQEEPSTPEPADEGGETPAGEEPDEETKTPPTEQPQPTPGPNQFLVARRPFRPELAQKGMLCPVNVRGIRLSMKEYGGYLTIQQTVPSGTRVEADGVLFTIDDKTIDKNLRDALYRADSTKKDLEQSRIRLETDQAGSNKDIEQARRRKTYAAEDLENYKTIEWPLAKDRSENGIRWQEASLADAQTELDQLEEMYKASELSGKTKEIVLERARRDIELRKNELGFARRSSAFDEEKERPRYLANYETELNAATIDLQLLETRTAMSIDDLKQTIAWQEMEVVKAEESLANLTADRAAMTAKSPIAGSVVHGDLVARIAAGWPGSPAPHECFAAGMNVQDEQVVLTVYTNEKYRVRLVVAEESWRLVRKGMEVKVRLTAIPGKQFHGRVVELADMPDCTDNNRHAFSAIVELEETDMLFRPGLEACAEYALDEVPDALVVPAHLVSDKGGRNFCLVVVDGANKEREIFVGGRRGDEIWIAGGLEEGDILVPKQ
ncbi:MAG: HlyD family efflux transporter periplasmic adaptor subunit [Planctomycetota bacterium]|nr:HlyD family efflux transporter periplasmic adaptor subunit [Planctomycetota bacterium]